MIATANTALLSKQALFGASILGCCCKDDEVDQGGSQFPDRPDRPIVVENPLITFTPPTQSEYVETQFGYEKPVSMRRISKRAILPPGISARRLTQGVQDSGIPDKALSPHGLNLALRDAFQKYLIWEEQEFLALILATDDNECCYECPD